MSGDSSGSGCQPDVAAEVVEATDEAQELDLQIAFFDPHGGPGGGDV